MKFKPKDSNLIAHALKPTQPTIWALRRNVQASAQDNHVEAPEPTGSLYEHLFGYDPIRVLNRYDAPRVEASAPVSADNPNLNILNSQTNFLVMELASEDVSKA